MFELGICPETTYRWCWVGLARGLASRNRDAPSRIQWVDAAGIAVLYEQTADLARLREYLTKNVDELVLKSLGRH